MIIVSKLSQYFAGGNQTLSDKVSANNLSKQVGSDANEQEQFFDQLHSKSQKEKNEGQLLTSSVLQSCRESKVDISTQEHLSTKEMNKAEACLDILDQEFDDARSLQRRTSQEHMKNSRSRNESVKTDDEEPKLFTFFSESHNPTKGDHESTNEKQSSKKEEIDPFDNIAMTQRTVKPIPPTTLETPKVTEQLPTSTYSTPVAPTPTTASNSGILSTTITSSNTKQTNEHSKTIPQSATPLLPQPVPRFDPCQPIRSPLPASNLNVKSSNLSASFNSAKERPGNSSSTDASAPDKWNRSDSAWIPSQNTAHILASLSLDTPPER